MRYKLRSSKQHPRFNETRGSGSDYHSDCQDVGGLSDDGEPKSKNPRTAVMHRRKKHCFKTIGEKEKVGEGQLQQGLEQLNITSLPQDIILLLIDLLDLDSCLCMLRTCSWFHSMLSHCDSFWKLLSLKTEFSNYSCLESDPGSQMRGWAGKEMHLNWRKEPGGSSMGAWHKTWRRGIQMRRNVVCGNFQGWRLFSNSSCPVIELTPGLDMNKVKQELGEFTKLSVNDDLKIDWDEKHLVLFHFFRGEGESCTIRLWDIEDEPKFLYQVDKGIECITDKVSVHNGYVVMVPSWPLEARAIVMTLAIRDNMEESGKYLFPDPMSQTALDENWEHTQLRVVRCQALVVCRAPHWMVAITSLPSCTPLSLVNLDQVSALYECQQIRSYKATAVILFTEKKSEQVCNLVTMDIQEAESRVRSYYAAQNVTDVALYTDPEEIYLMKKNGNVVLYDATLKSESLKIDNCSAVAAGSLGGGVPGPGGGGGGDISASDFQLFVNGKEQICVMQSAPEAREGRHINVYTYQGSFLYRINLDLYKYGLSRDESVCIYTNAAFLAAADSKRFVLFNVKNGNFVGVLQIPPHLERSKGKDEKDCMFEQTGLGLFIFDENKLIAVHDYERSFPAVLDIYKFW